MATKKTSTKSAKPAKRTSEPTTMAELLAGFGGSVNALTRGDTVEGTVTDILPKRLLVNIGGKGAGLVAEKAFDEAKSYIRTLKVGDKVTAQVIVAETPEGYTILSLRNTMQDASWDKVDKLVESGKPVSVRVKGVNQSGATVDISGLTGFVPNSFMGKKVLAKGQELIGLSIEVVVLEVDKTKNKVVASERHVSEKDKMDLAAQAVKNVKKGEIYAGEVVNVTDFGCFVQIEVPVGIQQIPLEGLVHVSELAWDKTGAPSDVVSVGDKVKVKVLEVGEDKSGRAEDARLALSMKQAQDDPWETVEKDFVVDSKHKGTVTRISDFGAFVQVKPGIEGLIHITKIPPDTKLEVGKKVDVVVEDVDAKERKLALSLVLTAIPVGYK